VIAKFLNVRRALSEPRNARRPARGRRRSDRTREKRVAASRRRPSVARARGRRTPESVNNGFPLQNLNDASAIARREPKTRATGARGARERHARARIRRVAPLRRHRRREPAIRAVARVARPGRTPTRSGSERSSQISPVEGCFAKDARNRGRRAGTRTARDRVTPRSRHRAEDAPFCAGCELGGGCACGYARVVRRRERGGGTGSLTTRHRRAPKNRLPAPPMSI
jgi:hypothetical protein